VFVHFTQPSLRALVLLVLSGAGVVRAQDSAGAAQDAQAMPHWNGQAGGQTPETTEAAPSAATPDAPPTPTLSQGAREEATAAPAAKETDTPPDVTLEEPPKVKLDDSHSKHPGGRFVFGSYGRVRAASDLRGKSGRSSNIVAFGSRNDLANYAEIELRREDRVDELDLKVVATLAVAGDFFHYDGDFKEDLAVRNLFADVNNVFIKGLGVWAGSRMVRGDDVYLLNFWPMDNLNLVGGGSKYTSDKLDLSLHGGLTRPNNPFYKQTIDVPSALAFTPTSYDLLDRPRSVVAAKATYFPLGKAPTAYKVSLYGETHHLPSGTRKTDVANVYEHLPKDQGFVLGAQLGGWLEHPKSFVNLFVRYASGIAVYDPLSTPMQIGTVTTASGAREWRVAVASNFEHRFVGVQFGGYMRGLRDEANAVLSGGKLLEGAVDVRPYFWFNNYAGLSLDAGYQALAVSKLDDRTGKQVHGGVTKLAAIPFISPYGKGTYTRPHIHLIYQLSLRDDGARHLYAERDIRSKQSTEHFFAVGAEWWFDSTSY
jgi:hypothetical protein